MKKNEKWEIFTQLVNEEINNTLKTWAFDPNELKTYAWGYRYVGGDCAAFGNNHGDRFFYFEKVINLAKGLHLRYELCVEINAYGKPTPCVMVFAK